MATILAIIIVYELLVQWGKHLDRTKQRKNRKEARRYYAFQFDKQRIRDQLLPSLFLTAQKKDLPVLNDPKGRGNMQYYSYIASVEKATKEQYPPTFSDYVQEKTEQQWKAAGVPLPESVYSLYSFEDCQWSEWTPAPQYDIDDWRRYYQEYYNNKVNLPYGVDLWSYNPRETDAHKAKAIQTYHNERQQKYQKLRQIVLSELRQVLYMQESFEYEYREELMKEDPEAAAELPITEKPVPLLFCNKDEDMVYPTAAQKHYAFMHRLWDRGCGLNILSVVFIFWGICHFHFAMNDLWVLAISLFGSLLFVFYLSFRHLSNDCVFMLCKGKNDYNFEAENVSIWILFAFNFCGVILAACWMRFHKHIFMELFIFSDYRYILWPAVGMYLWSWKYMIQYLLIAHNHQTHHNSCRT